jgi:AcrR family transcriptional regulator
MADAAPSGSPGQCARARAARTKRTRTRASLLAAADSAFSARSWQATRMEDVAAAAGVSTATAYNHFPTKHSLVGQVFAPHAAALLPPGRARRRRRAARSATRWSTRSTRWPG